jgi:hypothetical protein
MYNKDNLILESLYIKKVIKENNNKYDFEYAGIELYNNTLKNMSRQQAEQWVDDIYIKMQDAVRRKEISEFDSHRLKPNGLHRALQIYTIMGVVKEPDTALANKKPYKVTDSRDWFLTLDTDTDYFAKINGEPCFLYKREYDDSMEDNYDDDDDDDEPMSWVWSIENLFHPEDKEIETNSNEFAESRKEYLGE